MRLMRYSSLLLALAVTAATAADKFENKKIGLSVEPPAGFTVVEQRPENSPLGEVLGAYAAPNVEQTGSGLLIHLLQIPGEQEYEAFKGVLPELLKGLLGEKYKLIKQEDTKIEGLTGFMLEFESPGDGKLPMPGGNVLHHVRWYFFKQPERKLAGVLYTSRESSWNDIEPKVAASAKTLKHVE
jgi:hypothetical protein